MEKDKKVKMAVVGVGYLGSIHSRTYNRLKNVELVGVCDIDKVKAQRVARGCRCAPYTNYQDFFGKVEAASIVVPTVLHHQIAKDFLLQGINLLVEKPITTTVEEADELLHIADEKKLILQVGHVERFNAAIKTIEALSQGPKFIECSRLGPFKKRATDVGVVLDLMIHDIDIVLGLVKSEVERLDAIGVGVLTRHEDIANARLTFKNGAVCELTASRLTPAATRKIRMFAENAYVSLDYIKQAASIYTKEGQRINRKRINIKKEEPLKKELESFVNCVLTKQRPTVSGLEGREALKIALDIVAEIRKRPWIKE